MSMKIFFMKSNYQCFLSGGLSARNISKHYNDTLTKSRCGTSSAVLSAGNMNKHYKDTQ